MAGRITLAKAMVGAIPMFLMQVAKLPLSVFLEVECLQRNFVWGHGDHSRHFHAIGWDHMTKPKEYGGLGFRKLASVNRACSAKLAWNLILGAKGLWVDILWRKYMLREEDSLLNFRAGDSKLWGFICAQIEFIDQGAKW